MSSVSPCLITSGTSHSVSQRVNMGGLRLRSAQLHAPWSLPLASLEASARILEDAVVDVEGGGGDNQIPFPAIELPLYEGKCCPDFEQNTCLVDAEVVGDFDLDT